MNREIRILALAELRAMGSVGDTADPPRLEGYAANFNVFSTDPGLPFKESIRSGAFSRVISEQQDVRALFNHDPNIVLGRTVSKTLRLKQDDKGLFYSVDLPNTQQARDLHESVRRGDISGSSFSFAPVPGTVVWGESRDESGEYVVTRELTDVDVFDVSPVTYPAYESASVQARAAVEVPVELRSAVDAKNKALKEARAVVPTDIGECKPQDCPLVWTDAQKKAYCDAYNEAWKDGKKREGLEGEGLVAKAVGAAVMALHEIMTSNAQPGTEQQPASSSDVDKDGNGELQPGSQDDLNVRSEANKTEEKRDGLDDINADQEIMNDMSQIDMDEDLYGDDFDEASATQSHRDAMDGDEDCDDRACPCQNRWSVTGDERSADPEKRKKIRTKRVGGKDLPASKFAFVGDPEKTETWKLPIHDADHVRNALARFNQTKGIPEEKKDGVLAKIKAAAKKFGIEVSDDRAAQESEAIRSDMLADFAKRGLLGDEVFLLAERARDSAGKYSVTGDGMGENAEDEAAHRAASEEHYSKGYSEASRGHKPAAQAHMRAYSAHMDAAEAHEAKDPEATKQSNRAKKYSMGANKASRDAMQQLIA